MLINKIRF